MQSDSSVFALGPRFTCFLSVVTIFEERIGAVLHASYGTLTNAGTFAVCSVWLMPTSAAGARKAFS